MHIMELVASVDRHYPGDTCRCGHSPGADVPWHPCVVPNGTWGTASGTAILPTLCDSGTVEELMGCLFAMFAGFFPRLAVTFIWIARPQLFTAAFGGSWFVPLLGILF